MKKLSDKKRKEIFKELQNIFNENIKTSIKYTTKEYLDEQDEKIEIDILFIDREYETFIFSDFWNDFSFNIVKQQHIVLTEEQEEKIKNILIRILK